MAQRTKSNVVRLAKDKVRFIDALEISISEMCSARDQTKDQSFRDNIDDLIDTLIDNRNILLSGPPEPCRNSRLCPNYLCVPVDPILKVVSKD